MGLPNRFHQRFPSAISNFIDFSGSNSDLKFGVLLKKFLCYENYSNIKHMYVLCKNIGLKEETRAALRETEMKLSGA